MVDRIKQQLPKFYIQGELVVKEVLGKGSFAVVKKVCIMDSTSLSSVIQNNVSVLIKQLDCCG